MVTYNKNLINKFINNDNSKMKNINTEMYRLNTIQKIPKIPKRFINRKFYSGTKQNSEGLVDTSELFFAISELKNKFDIKLESFPVVTVFGSQSSGKTSVVEAICNTSIFPKGMGISTLKPFYITTIKSTNIKVKINDKELSSEKEIREEIDKVNSNELIKTVNIIIESPDVYNNYLVDLPGLFVVADKNNKDFPKAVRKMNIEHLNYPNSIPVVVHSAPSDPATNQGIQLINKLDREQDAFGIITKIDMIQNQNNSLILQMLKGNKYPLGFGYCGVILRNDSEIGAGKSIKDKMNEEQSFAIKNTHIYPFGTNEMKKRLSNIQFQKIKGIIPNLITDIDKEIGKYTASEAFLDMLIDQNDNKFIVKLKIMIEKLVGSSIERCEFEDQLKKSLGLVIREHLEKTFQRENNQEYIPTMSTAQIDPAINTFHSKNRSDPDLYKTDTFKELFCFGLLAPTTTDNNTVRKALENESLLSCTLPLFDFIIDDPLGKKRLQWNKYLNNYFNSLLTNDNIQNIIHKITVDKLIEYIEGDIEQVNISKTFVEYMIKEISNEAYETHIRYSIAAIINIEKRPLISLVEVARHLTQIYHDKFVFRGGFFELFSRNNKKLVVQVYSDHWNEAYLRAVADKIVENCYRNVAVNLLDKMVERLLGMTISMINKKNAEKEKSKVTDKINKLHELRIIITKYIH